MCQKVLTPLDAYIAQVHQRNELDTKSIISQINALMANMDLLRQNHVQLISLKQQLTTNILQELGERSSSDKGQSQERMRLDVKELDTMVPANIKNEVVNKPQELETEKSAFITKAQYQSLWSSQFDLKSRISKMSEHQSKIVESQAELVKQAHQNNLRYDNLQAQLEKMKEELSQNIVPNDVEVIKTRIPIIVHESSGEDADGEEESGDCGETAPHADTDEEEEGGESASQADTEEESEEEEDESEGGESAPHADTDEEDYGEPAPHADSEEEEEEIEEEEVEEESEEEEEEESEGEESASHADSDSGESAPHADSEEEELEEESEGEEEEEEEEIEEEEEESGESAPDADTDDEDEEEEEESEEEEEEEEVIEYEYKGKKYYVDSMESGPVYECLDDESIGEEIGKIVKGTIMVKGPSIGKKTVWVKL